MFRSSLSLFFQARMYHIEVVGATIHINIISAHDLENKEIRGMVDPYVIFRIGKGEGSGGEKENKGINEYKTKRIDNTCNPIWNEKCIFSIRKIGNFDKLDIAVKDWNVELFSTQRSCMSPFVVHFFLACTGDDT